MKWSDEGSLNLGFVVMCVVSVNSERSPAPFGTKGAGFGGSGGAKSLIRSACERAFETSYQ